MKKNNFQRKLYVFLIILITVVVFSTAAICNNCSASGINKLTSSSLTGESSSAQTQNSQADNTSGNQNTSSLITAENSFSLTNSAVESIDSSTTYSTSASTTETTSSSSTSTTSSTDSSSGTPTIALQIYEGPTYSSADGIYYYRIEAIVTGNPNPTISFSRDDSHGAWGSGRVQVNLNSGVSYTLTAAAANSHGSANALIVLTAPGGSSSGSDSGSSTSGTNRPPDVSEISLSGTIIITNSTYPASVTASDLDGDALTCNWTVTGGSIADAHVNPAQWRTPGTTGDCTLSVTVSDGHGGNVTKTKTVAVSIPTAGMDSTPDIITVQTLNLPIVFSEGGYIEHEGYINAGGCLYAGDSNNDKYCQGFVSFNITGIAGAQIQSAILTFNGSNVYGNPSSIFSWISVFAGYWGARPLTQDVERATVSNIDYPSNPNFTCNGGMLINRLQDVINAGRDRFQIVIAAGPGYTNDNGAWDGWEYQQSNITLHITCIPAI